MKGSGMPLVGIMPKTTLMLMSACTTTMAVMPVARKRANGSCVFMATRMPRHRKMLNRTTTSTAPHSPSSSAILA